MARVLVVDDDPAGLEIRKLVLERQGHVVTAAGDPGSARSAFHATAPEAVILDIRLPQPEDGLALIREFRAAAPGARIVVLCGNGADLDARPEQALVDEILVKPVRSERLLDAITQPLSVHPKSSRKTPSAVPPASIRSAPAHRSPKRRRN